MGSAGSVSGQFYVKTSTSYRNGRLKVGRRIIRINVNIRIHLNPNFVIYACRPSLRLWQTWTH